MDPVVIYKKLVAIKPFFDMVPIDKPAVVHTRRRAQLTRGGDGVWREPVAAGGSSNVHHHRQIYYTADSVDDAIDD
jgi:hypothetical protein